jgi:hypothetical protein
LVYLECRWVCCFHRSPMHDKCATSCPHYSFPWFSSCSMVSHNFMCCFHRPWMHNKCATSRPWVILDYEFTHVWYLENGSWKLTWCVKCMHGPNAKGFMQTCLLHLLNENLQFWVEFQSSYNGMLNTCVFSTNICYIWRMTGVSPLKTSFVYALAITRLFTNFRLRLGAISVNKCIPL